MKIGAIQSKDLRFRGHEEKKRERLEVIRIAQRESYALEIEKRGSLEDNMLGSTEVGTEVNTEVGKIGSTEPITQPIKPKLDTKI